MYEREIKMLHSARQLGPGMAKAVDIAIALMRTAQPKDEAAERAHCADTAERAGGQPGLAARIYRERAAARAPLQARIAELEARLERLGYGTNEEP